MIFSIEQKNMMKRVVSLNIDKIPQNFDWRSYLLRNQDVNDHGFSDEISAKYHFILYGHKENREWHKIESDLITNNHNKIINKKINAKHICVSILLYYPEDRSIKFLSHFPILLLKECLQLGVKKLTFIIRNNSNGYNDNSVKYYTLKLLDYVKDYAINLKIIYHNNYNMGYGLGHNNNLLSINDADIFIITNDDMGFPNLNWLSSTISAIEEENIGIVGSIQSPHIISDFVDGHSINFGKLKEPEYIEGSLLVVNPSIFKRLNGFDKNIKYFYFEDVDLCLRCRQLGYKISIMNVPHQHYRSTSTSRINTTIKSSIIEYNRSYFFAKWKNYMNTREMSGKILIDLSSDGIGDLVDCFYPLKELLNSIDKNIKIDMVLSGKIRCLYNYFIMNNFNINYITKSDITYNEENYDSIYTIKDINFSVPLHTTDIIAAKFGLNNFDTDATSVKEFISHQLLYDENLINNLPDTEYIVLHVDSQRKNFDGRIPDDNIILELLDKLSDRYKIILIGQNIIQNKKLNNLISLKKIYDHRNSTIDHMLKIINSAQIFIGLDSGPSHMAQLLNIPSYVIYGPINPATKIFRYHNSGCYYNLNKEVVNGSYHLYLEPAYHHDIRGDNATMPTNSSELMNSILSFIDAEYSFDWIPIFESLRQNQREFLMVQMHNPLFKNKILTKQNVSLKSRVDAITDIVSSYEKYASKLI